MFVEAAERSSFAGAAEALNVTQAAVSKQMASLEDRLNISLFFRGHRSVGVTPAGQAYLPVAKRVLALLESGLDDATALSSRRSITIEVDYEFLDFVVTPRLDRLCAQLSETDVTFLPTVPGRHVPQSDLSITYGHPRPGRVSAERLCGFRVFPVASPFLLETTSDPLKELPLLHDVDSYWWNTFLQAENITRFDQGTVLGNGALAIRAAMAGQGIAIGDDVLCADALRRGDLVRVGGTALHGRDDYWVSEHPDMLGDPIAASFRKWLKAEVAQLFENAQSATWKPAT
ncbi:LysR family transcriptional regulator [Denitrobaculum tricleocarpae]|nr:LysR family transcriptional regulator [Denitrobaculum tricleocarpae]